MTITFDTDTFTVRSEANGLRIFVEPSDFGPWWLVTVARPDGSVVAQRGQYDEWETALLDGECMAYGREPVWGEDCLWDIVAEQAEMIQEASA